VPLGSSDASTGAAGGRASRNSGPCNRQRQRNGHVANPRPCASRRIPLNRRFVTCSGTGGKAGRVACGASQRSVGGPVALPRPQGSDPGGTPGANQRWRRGCRASPAGWKREGEPSLIEVRIVFCAAAGYSIKRELIHNSTWVSVSTTIDRLLCPLAPLPPEASLFQ
jgi:hypothetical protein